MGNIIAICLVCALIGVKVGVALRLLTKEKSCKSLVRISGIGGIFAVVTMVFVPAIVGGTLSTTLFIGGIASGTIGAALGGVICDAAAERLSLLSPDTKKKDEEPTDKK